MNADYSIQNMGKTVTFYDLEGNKREGPLSTVHVKSVEDLNNIPKEIADTILPGSLAFLTDMSIVWQKGFDGEWEEVEL